jgi:hypothetical protein
LGSIATARGVGGAIAMARGSTGRLDGAITRAAWRVRWAILGDGE